MILPESERIRTRSAGAYLSEEHRRELEEGSGICPELLERYVTVTREEARSLGFSKAQARPGWVAKLVSPSGEISYTLKPNMPRTDERARIIKYEIRAGHDLVIDVGARTERIQSLEPLIVTEGAKKADALATHGRLPINLTGVWNWGKKRKRGGAKYGRPELLPDWDDIPLEGRKVYIAFDADYREKPNVALAMMRLAERLTERGADVYIMSLPGPEKGIDDFLVAGGDLEALERSARPFEACEFIAYVAKGDKRIHEVVSGNLARMRRDVWAGCREKTAHSLLRAYLEMGLERGRYSRTEEGVELTAPIREAQLRASVGCRKTVAKADELLAERGYLKKITGDRETGRANRYILKFAEIPPHNRGEGENALNTSIPGGVSENFTPHLRWAAPSPPDDHPERGEGSPSRPMRSPGKLAELALWLLSQWGGGGTLRDLATVSGVGDTSKMRKELEDLDEAGVVGMDPKGKHGARVWLTEEWRAMLGQRRERAGEFAKSRQQAVKHRKARESFRSGGAADKQESPLRGPEEMALLLEKRREEERERWVEEQRQKVGETAATFLADELEGITAVRFKDVRERWQQRGGRLEDLRPAVLYGPFRFKREDDGVLYVHHADGPGNGAAGPNDRLFRERLRQAQQEEAAPRPEPEHKLPPMVKGIYQHGPLCGCEWCNEAPEPSYVRMRGAS